MSNITKIRISGQTYNIVDETAIHSLAGYSTTSEMNDAITAATGALAESIAEQGYQTSGDVQTAIENGITGKAETSDVQTLSGTVTAHTASTDIHVTVANKNLWDAKLDASDITGLFGYSEYDSTSKHINFYHDNTKTSVISYIDATDFVKDGMVSNVEVKAVTIEGQSVTCLVITFNTDSGKEAINIPISQIFNADNYYTKTQVDTALGGKADTATTYTKTEVDDALTAKTNNSTFTAYTASTDTALSGKQATLVSGTNIKTINNQSLLGSGNIIIEAAGVIDTQMSDSSTNAVQNNTIKSYVDTAVGGKNQVITLDSETLVIS